MQDSMITRDIHAFLAFARGAAPDFGPATARAAFLVAPDGFALAEQSAQDNVYMADAAAFDAQRASMQHRDLQRAISAVLPTVCFAGDPATPDALFPNNVFGTAAGRTVIGRMRHPVRQREAARSDIRGFFADVLDRQEIDLSAQEHPCELTGALVIDRARGIGYCGLSERCDMAGVEAMHEAFGLRLTYCFELAAGEYHTNVVLAVLAGRAAIIAASGFRDRAAATAIASLYGAHVVCIDEAQKQAYAANAISLSSRRVWMSSRAAGSLAPAQVHTLEDAGFAIGQVELGEIEKAGGSLRCCVGEVF